jgi:hypothetical protein
MSRATTRPLQGFMWLILLSLACWQTFVASLSTNNDAKAAPAPWNTTIARAIAFQVIAALNNNTFPCLQGISLLWNQLRAQASLHGIKPLLQPAYTMQVTELCPATAAGVSTTLSTSAKCSVCWAAKLDVHRRARLSHADQIQCNTRWPIQ